MLVPAWVISNAGQAMTSPETKQPDWFDWAESFLADGKARDTEWDESFMPNAARVMALASQAASSLNQDYVGAEHLLAGMLKLGSGAAAVALKHAGLTLPLLKEEIESARGAAGPKKVGGAIPYTSRGKDIIMRARARAQGVRVEVEDLLVELLAEREGLPASVFRKRAIDVEKIKRAIAREACQ